MIPIVIVALRKVPKALEKGMEESEIIGKLETIQTTALLKSAKILRRVLETWGDTLSLRLHQKTISLPWSKKFARSKIIS